MIEGEKYEDEEDQLDDEDYGEDEDVGRGRGGSSRKRPRFDSTTELLSPYSITVMMALTFIASSRSVPQIH